MVEESVILKRDGLQILEADSKAVFQLLLIYCLLLLQLWGLLRCFLFCYAILCVLSSFAIILTGKRIDGCFTLIVFLVFCDCYCSVALPRGAVGWSSVCDCCISWSYSFIYFFENKSKMCKQTV